MQTQQDFYSEIVKHIGSADPGVYMEDDCFMGADGLPRCNRCKEPRARRVNLPKPSKCYVYRPCSCKAWGTFDEAARRREELERRMKAISIADQRHYDATFDRFQSRNEADQKLLAGLRQYVEDWDRHKSKNDGILLYGPVGTGKTFAGCCVANALRENGIASCIIDTGRLIRQDAKDFEAGLNTIRKVDFLLLDDFGTESENAYVLERVYRIIDTRYNAKKPLWITTNFVRAPDNKNLSKQRIWSRIFEMCKSVKVDGMDRRIARKIAQ